jgi:hypothetical protein
MVWPITAAESYFGAESYVCETVKAMNTGHEIAAFWVLGSGRPAVRNYVPLAM